MTTTFKTYTALAAGLVLAAVALVAVGLTQPQAAEAQACRTQTFSSDVSTFIVNDQYESNSNSDSLTINPGSYGVASDEYIKTVTVFDAAVSAQISTTCRDDENVDCSAFATVDVGPYDPGNTDKTITAGVQTSVGPGPNSDTDSGDLIFSRSESAAGDSIDLNATVSADNGTPAPGDPQPVLVSQASASAEDGFRLEICPISAGNSAPVANNDGALSSRIPADGSNVTSVNVLANDTDPDGDNLTISTASTDESDTSVSIVSGATMLSYDPTGYTGTYPLEDEIDYTIEDPGGLTDTATAFISVTGAGTVGNVTIQAGNSTSEGLMSGDDPIMVNPEYTDNRFAGGEDVAILDAKPLSDAVEDGWNVTLYEDTKYFNLRNDMITPPAGYRLTSQENFDDEGFSEPAPIDKNPDNDAGFSNITGLETSIALGIAPSGGGGGPLLADAQWTFVERFGPEDGFRFTLDAGGSSPSAEITSYDWTLTQSTGSALIPAAGVTEGSQEEVATFEVYDEPREGTEGSEGTADATYDITLEVSDGTDTASDDISIQIECTTDTSGNTSCFWQDAP